MQYCGTHRAIVDWLGTYALHSPGAASPPSGDSGWIGGCTAPGAGTAFGSVARRASSMADVGAMHRCVTSLQTSDPVDNSGFRRRRARSVFSRRPCCPHVLADHIPGVTSLPDSLAPVRRTAPPPPRSSPHLPTHTPLISPNPLPWTVSAPPAQRLLGERLIKVFELEGQAYGVESQQPQLVHHAGKVLDAPVADRTQVQACYLSIALRRAVQAHKTRRRAGRRAGMQSGAPPPPFPSPPSPPGCIGPGPTASTLSARARERQSKQSPSMQLSCAPHHGASVVETVPADAVKGSGLGAG